MRLWHKILSGWKRKPDKKPSLKQQEEPVQEEAVCCDQNAVHVAYRGLSDGRLYLSYHRQWQEVRYFRPQGLKVFCARCRQRIL